MSAQTFYIETHGCQMNEHDSEKISGLLTHRGLRAVGSLEDADLYILNTCSVREKAAHRVYSRLGEVRAEKENRPGLLIGVVGCVAQQEGETMVRRAPYVDMVVGTHLYHELPDLLDKIESGRRQVATRFLGDPAPVEIPTLHRESGFRAQVTIMEGCNKHCAFCIVPHTRGPERNRPAAAILDEIRRVADDGYAEVMLLGQTVNSYRDPQRAGYKFAELLADVASVHGIGRIRFTSPHPRHFSQDVIDVIATAPNICDHVHLPLQSGSSRVLKRMRRQHDRDWYLRLVDDFRGCGRDIALSTDMIVGFPGESEADFEETMSMVRQVRFESMFSFKYSPRPNTEAVEWDDDVAELEKGRWLMQLQRLQREIQLEIHNDRYLGGQWELLVEGAAKDGSRLFGRTTTNKVVNFDGCAEPGTFTDVTITEAAPNSFVGEVATTPRTQVRRRHGARV